MRTTRLPGGPCPSCGEQLDAATDVKGTDRPSPGDYTVCLHCAVVLRFDAALGLALAETWPPHVERFAAAARRARAERPA